MALSPGKHLGRYEILKPLGAGGMGEVYRARDTRLDREVAIKILPESVARDPERLARFDREAKAVAALSHPNILALHDVGTEDGTTFAVMELLEGENLRDWLASGPLPVRRAIDTAIQVARGLAAAHAKGLVHRDLKPENVFLMADGQVKILDFGLAKAADPGDSGATATQAAMTDPGQVMGTVGYMAPEQVRGHAVDARTDPFALGAVLYEMASGERAFRRETAAETMTAILREDPPELSGMQTAQAPSLDRIIRHCLEKNPAERFQSAKDVAFALDSLSGTTVSSGPLPQATSSGSVAHPHPRTGVFNKGVLAATALGVVAIACVAAWATGYLHFGAAPSAGVGISQVTYQPVTFDEGFVFAARFARDGRTIVYSADWENRPRDIFVTSLDNTGSRALGYKGADLLSVSPDGALAILMNGEIMGGNPYGRRGRIARASLNGGAPREELAGVSFADFARDGSIAVSRIADAGSTLEWPQERVIAKIGNFRLPFPNVRVSPAGENLAHFDCDSSGCTMKIVSKSGDVIATSRPFFDWWGLAWAPDGREVWFAVAETNGRQCTLYGLDLAGRQRLIFRAPGAVTLHDLSADGRLLVSFDQVNTRIEMRERAASAAPPRDLSWKEGGYLTDVSADGTVLFYEQGDSAGPSRSVYVRRPGDAEPVRISDGVAIAISNDGSKALVRSHTRPLQLSIVPATGLAQKIDIGPFERIEGVWLPDGRLLLDVARTAQDRMSVYVRPAAGGALEPFLPAGINLGGPRAVSPDGRHIAAVGDKGPVICAVPQTGVATCTPLPVPDPDSVAGFAGLAGWTADSSALLVYRKSTAPIRIERMSITTGKLESYATFQPATAAVSGLQALFVTPSGTIVYGYMRNRSALYVINGLK